MDQDLVERFDEVGRVGPSRGHASGLGGSVQWAVARGREVPPCGCPAVHGWRNHGTGLLPPSQENGSAPPEAAIDPSEHALFNTRVLVWDAFNRLVAVARKSDGAAIAAYSYLPDGRRSRKVVFSQTNPGVVEREVRFAWDGAQEVEEQSAAGVTLATFVWSPVYVDELVEFRREAAHPLGAGSFYAHQDVRCDVVAVTNASGVVVEKRRYDDFGREEIRDAGGAVLAASPSGLEYGFQGRRRDQETGWLYFRARFYDPEVGRFLSRDPVWDAGNVGGWYTFVGNGPVSGRDPSGLSDWEELKRRFKGKRPLQPQINEPAVQGVDKAVKSGTGQLAKNAAKGLGEASGPIAVTVAMAEGQEAAWENVDAQRGAVQQWQAYEKGRGDLFKFRAATGHQGPVQAFTTWFTRTQGRVPTAAEIAAYEAALTEGKGPQEAAEEGVRLGQKPKSCPKTGEEDKEEPEIVSLWKAPRANQPWQRWVQQGFQEGDFPGSTPQEPWADATAYFASPGSRRLADEWSTYPGYGQGVVEVQLPRDAYDALFGQNEREFATTNPRIIGTRETPIPASLMQTLNNATVRRIHHP